VKRRWYDTRGPAWLPLVLALCFTVLFVDFAFFDDGEGTTHWVATGLLGVVAVVEWAVTVAQWRRRQGR
jgi:hypothetical protein